MAAHVPKMCTAPSGWMVRFGDRNLCFLVLRGFREGCAFIFHRTDVFSEACSQSQGKGKRLSPFAKTRNILRDLTFLQTQGNEKDKAT